MFKFNEISLVDYSGAFLHFKLYSIDNVIIVDDYNSKSIITFPVTKSGTESYNVMIVNQCNSSFDIRQVSYNHSEDGYYYSIIDEALFLMGHVKGEIGGSDNESLDKVRLFISEFIG